MLPDSENTDLLFLERWCSDEDQAAAQVIGAGGTGTYGLFALLAACAEARGL